MALDFNTVDFGALAPQFQADENSSIMQSQLGAASQAPLLVLENGMFVVKKGGKVIQQFEGQTVNVIIHEIPPQNGRVMYPGKYNPTGPAVDPLCWSADGNRPHETVPQAQRQGNDCSLCPQNQKGSAGEGDYKNCSSTTQILVSTVAAPDVLLRFNVNGSTAFGESYLDSNFFSFNQYIDFIRVKKLELGRVATALCIDRQTPGANNKTLFAPMAIMEDTDAPWQQHLIFKRDLDLPKLVRPFYMTQAALPGPAQDPNLVAPGAVPVMQPVAVAQPMVQPLAMAQPAAVAQPMVQPVAMEQPAAVAQPMVQPVAMEQPAAVVPVAMAQPQLSPQQVRSNAVAGGAPLAQTLEQAGVVGAVPGDNVAPGSLPAVPALDTTALGALGAQVEAQPAAPIAPVAVAAVAPVALAPVAELAPIAVAPVPVAALAAVPVAAAAVTDSTTTALDGLASMDLSSMLGGFGDPAAG